MQAMESLGSLAFSRGTIAGYHAVSKSQFLSCYQEPLLLLMHNLPLTARCVLCAAATSRITKLGCIRASVDVSQAASIGLPPTSLDREPQSPAVTWSQFALQGPRSEMEDAVTVRLDGLNGYAYAAVFDGHAGFSSVKFLREELYAECSKALQNGSLLASSEFSIVENALTSAFVQADSRLLSWLEETGDELESGSTATVLFVGRDSLVVAHVGDSRVVIARAGKAEVLSEDHRPYGKSKTSLAEIKRIRHAGGWINNGRVCGILSVSRAFGDIKLKSQRQEMLERGVKEGLWTTKFASRIEMNGDWVTAAPEVTKADIRDADFIILASDGLWDFVQSSEAVRIVKKQLQQHGDAQRACEVLANTALERNGQDNVSVVIADLGKVQKLPNGPLEEDNLGNEVGQAIVILGIVGLSIWLSQNILW